MTDTLFSALGLSEKLQQAITAMGFQLATPIQAQAIPLIRTGVDVIARSQTGTGKTVAFSVPAMECIDSSVEKPVVQVIILCPTRELAQQASGEIRKLAKFMPHVHPVEIYGGTNMENQFIRLRHANLIIGTPGRVMDHMRRKTLKLDHLKMVILDEADEMLKMGFKEDIETILQGAPETRQTILFSATIPPAIMSLVGQFQKTPQLIEISKEQITIKKIEQRFIDVHAAGKADALVRLLRFHRPNRALVFCNTKRMVDELTLQLNQSGFAAESIHGDLGQAQRTSVMNGFKHGKVSILVATDVAARGIDVNDLDYVFNFDIPSKTEHYVHRIGRTGRAGKSGCAITICCGKRQIRAMCDIARETHSEITPAALPTISDIQKQELTGNLSAVEVLLEQAPDQRALEMVHALAGNGHSLEQIAATALQHLFHTDKVFTDSLPATSCIPSVQKGPAASQDKHISKKGPAFVSVHFDIGSANRVSPKHFVGAITELSGISGKEIGDIKIYEDYSVVSIPEKNIDAMLVSMRNCKICGKMTHVSLASGTFSRNVQGNRATSKAAEYATKHIASYKEVTPGDPIRRRAMSTKQAG